MTSADLDPPDPLVGATVAGRYHVVRKLAVGGMGIVYEARQEPLGRRVALKVIRGDTSDAVSRQRFEREARAASALQHQNVVVVHDFGVIDGGVGDGGLFLAMEYVEGDTLREKLADAGRMPWERSRAIVVQIARALDEAHSHQLVHRDLKPENVMVVVDGRTTSCKVLDFGLAKGTGHDTLLRSGSSPLTRSGGFVGTPGYISPEVLDGADDHPRQDVYALGVVWWELLTGHHPFPAETPMKTLVRQMHEDPPVVDDALRAADNIPPAGVELLRRMMARDPLQRPQHGGELVAHLEALAPAHPSSSDANLGVEHATIDGDAATADTIRNSPPPSSAQRLAPWPTKQEALTVQGRKRPMPTPTSSPSSSSSVSSSTPPTGAQGTSTAEPPRRLSRARWRVMGAVVAAAGIGAAVASVVTLQLDDVGDATVVVDAGVSVVVPEPVDAGVVTTEIIVQGAPTFAALKALREHLPPHTLRVYRRGEGELTIAGDVTTTVADALEDLTVVVDQQSYLVEVGDLVGGRVVVTMKPSAVVLPDAGVDVAPGGLEP